MQWLEWVHEPQAWIALGTLTALEIVLGIDNIVFLSILSGRLPGEQQRSARRVGLLMAMGMRILLLFMLSWIMQLQEPLFALLGRDFSGRDLILLGGGLFLIAKATLEIHHKLEGDGPPGMSEGRSVSYGAVLVQVALLDLVFSLDSVITAVGMARHLPVMVLAVVISVIVMIVFVNPICDFVDRHPTFKMLALSFLVLVGFALVGEGFHLEIPKGYIYSAMGFSLVVELLNLRVRKSTQPPVRLKGLDRDGGDPAPG